MAERQLCTGCGICAFIEPETIEIVDDARSGRRPVVRSDAHGLPLDRGQALSVCPGLSLAHDAPPRPKVPDVDPMWGPVVGVWEGYAADPAVRFAGSSGGAATALALHGVERRGDHGVLQIRQRDGAPLRNETVLSDTREDLLAATGSRYGPASPAERLDLITGADGPCMFIGKPCDVAAVTRARRNDEQLDAKVSLTVAIFCAGTPTYAGTAAMLQAMGIDDPDQVRSLRYRGNGWPGEAEAVIEGPGGEETRRLTYDQSWNSVLQKHRQWRCYVCADHTGEFADVAVGDPWHRPIEDDDPGRSLVIARTKAGRRAVEAAIADGYLLARPAPGSVIAQSQPGLAQVRGAVWGRIAASRLLGIPAPRFRNLPSFRAFVRLPLREQLRATVGLVRRARRKGLWSRQPVERVR